MVQGGQVAGGDVGGVAHQHVKLPQGMAGGLEGIPLQVDHPAGEAVAADVPLTQLQGPVRQVHQHRPGGFHQGRRGDAQAAGAGAQVQNPGVAGVLLQAVHGQLGQHLRVHPGDQDLRAHIEGQAAEGPLPNEIGDGLPCQPTGQEGLGLHGDLVGGVQGDVPVEFLRRFSGGGADQFPGLQLGGLNPRPGEGHAGVQIQIMVGDCHLSPPNA